MFTLGVKENFSFRFGSPDLLIPNDSSKTNSCLRLLRRLLSHSWVWENEARGKNIYFPLSYHHRPLAKKRKTANHEMWGMISRLFFRVIKEFSRDWDEDWNIQGLIRGKGKLSEFWFVLTENIKNKCRKLKLIRYHWSKLASNLSNLPISSSNRKIQFSIYESGRIEFFILIVAR